MASPTGGSVSWFLHNGWANQAGKSHFGVSVYFNTFNVWKPAGDIKTKSTTYPFVRTELGKDAGREVCAHNITFNLNSAARADVKHSWRYLLLWMEISLGEGRAHLIDLYSKHWWPSVCRSPFLPHSISPWTQLFWIRGYEQCCPVFLSGSQMSWFLAG